MATPDLVAAVGVLAEWLRVNACVESTP